MPRIELLIEIKAPVTICFDLARSIDLHVLSQEKAREKAIAGVTSGLISLGETVTWEARHFGLKQHLTTRITEFVRPHFFTDEMIRGAFRSFRHEHHFREWGFGTRMLDVFIFESPLGLLGKLANRLVLTRYMIRLLQERNKVIKEVAESGRWEEILGK